MLIWMRTDGAGFLKSFSLGAGLGDVGRGHTSEERGNRNWLDKLEVCSA